MPDLVSILSDPYVPVLALAGAMAAAYWILERAEARERRERMRRGFDVSPPAKRSASHVD